MFCTKCGSRNPENAEFCWNCGKPVFVPGSDKEGGPDLRSECVPVAQVSAPEVPEEQIAPWKALAIGLGVATTDQKSHEEYLPASPPHSGSTVPPMEAEGSQGPDQPPDSSLQGVSGWLLLFCIGATIVTPLYCLADALSNLSDALVVLIDVGFAAFALYTGILVWRVRPNALKLVKAYLISNIVLAMLTVIGAIIQSGTSRTDGSPGVGFGAMGVALRILVFVIVWWSYFERSKRVGATFGRTLSSKTSLLPK
jgi:hypothetical protein